MSDVTDVNTRYYWRHLAANVRFGIRGVADQEAKQLLQEIADRYDTIGNIVEERARS